MANAKESLPSPHLGGFIMPVFGNVLRPSSAKSRTLRNGVLIGVWVVTVITLLHLVFYSRFLRPADRVIAFPTKGAHDGMAQHPPPLIPRKIWQIFLKPPKADKKHFNISPDQLSDSASWLARNRDYEYVLVGDGGADTLIREHFDANQTLLDIFHKLSNTGMKSDLLRYMLLSVQGGVYSDIDTEALKPVDSWVPVHYRNATRAIIGLEFDRLDGPQWAEVHPDLQFCQWTIAAAPGHAIFSDLIESVVRSLTESVAAQNTTLEELKVGSSDVMKLTGPYAWTEAVYRHLHASEPELTSLTNLSGLAEPRLVGDVLILPIDGFGMGQLHSKSTNDGTTPAGALVKHKFRGSWRQDGR